MFKRSRDSYYHDYDEELDKRIRSRLVPPENPETFPAVAPHALSSILSFSDDPTALVMTRRDLYGQHLGLIQAHLDSQGGAAGAMDAREVYPMLAALTEKSSAPLGQYEFPPEQFAEIATQFLRVVDILPQIWGSDTQKRLLLIYFRSCRPEYEEIRQGVWGGFLHNFSVTVDDELFSHTMARVMDVMQRRLDRDVYKTAHDDMIRTTFSDIGAVFSPEFRANRKHLTQYFWDMIKLRSGAQEDTLRMWVHAGMPYYNDEVRYNIYPTRGFTLLHMLNTRRRGLQVFAERPDRTAEFSGMVERFFKLDLFHETRLFSDASSAEEYPEIAQKYESIGGDVHDILSVSLAMDAPLATSDPDDPDRVWRKALVSILLQRRWQRIIEALRAMRAMQQDARSLSPHFMERTVLHEIVPVANVNGVAELGHVVCLMEASNCFDWSEFFHVFVDQAANMFSLPHAEFLGAVLGTTEQPYDNPHALTELINDALHKVVFRHALMTELENEPEEQLDLFAIERKIVSNPGMLALKHLLAFANRRGVLISVHGRSGSEGNDSRSTMLPLFLLERWEDYMSAEIMFGYLHNEIAGQLDLMPREDRLVLSNMFSSLIVTGLQREIVPEEIETDVQRRFYSDGAPRLTNPALDGLRREDANAMIFAVKLLRHRGISRVLKEHLLMHEAVSQACNHDEGLIRRILALVA